MMNVNYTQAKTDMRYGIVINGAKTFSAAIDMVCEAEAAGWDGFFLPDGIAIQGFPFFDPWVMMGAIAQRTTKIRFGPLITPVTRRRPWKLAKECVTVDHLSNGRLILGVGLGAAEDDEGFKSVGEATDLKVRARRTDESLQIIDGLWKEKPFSFSGEHFRVDKMLMVPQPIQKPRIPIWVVGVWNKPKSMKRALAWDGFIVQTFRGTSPLSAEEIRKVKDYVAEHRADQNQFEIIASGSTSGKTAKRPAEIVRPFIDAGATWWIEGDPKLDRIRKGPPV